MIDIKRLKCPLCSQKLVICDNQINCVACEFEYFHNVAAAVGFIECDDKLLVLTRAHEPQRGKLHLPGGFVGSGETLEQALAREVKEESNLEVLSQTYLFSAPNTYDYCGITYNVVDSYFSVVVKSLASLQLNNESLYYSWQAKGSIAPDSVAFVSVRNALGQMGYLKS
jgi:NAD+ diphosphatase